MAVARTDGSASVHSDDARGSGTAGAARPFKYPAGEPPVMQRSRLRRYAALVLATLAGLVVWLVERARAGAREAPVSRVTAGWYVGPTSVERRGWATGEQPVGELDDVDVLASDRFDPDRLAPEIRRFYEQTDDYAMTFRTTWHRPFRSGAALASRLTSRIEQLNLPGPGDTGWHQLESRFVGVSEPGADAVGREAVRAWVRTDAVTGDAVFVALYGLSEANDERLVNIAAPLPGGNVSTVLRPEHADVRVEGETAADSTGGDAIRFTTRGTGDPGLYLRTLVGAFELPMEQEFRVWTAPADVDWDLGGVHEMWLCGRQFLTVDYRIRREA